MKKIITIAVVMTVICGGIFWYNQTHFVGYVYVNSGTSYDDGIAKGDNWVMTGERSVYSYNELKELGKDHDVKLTGLLGGPTGLVFVLSEDTVLMVPGLSFDSGISETYSFF